MKTGDEESETALEMAAYEKKKTDVAKWRSCYGAWWYWTGTAREGKADGEKTAGVEWMTGRTPLYPSPAYPPPNTKYL